MSVSNELFPTQLLAEVSKIFARVVLHIYASYPCLRTPYKGQVRRLKKLINERPGLQKLLGLLQINTHHIIMDHYICLVVVYVCERVFVWQIPAIVQWPWQFHESFYFVWEFITHILNLTRESLMKRSEKKKPQFWRYCWGSVVDLRWNPWTDSRVKRKRHAGSNPSSLGMVVSTLRVVRLVREPQYTLDNHAVMTLWWTSSILKDLAQSLEKYCSVLQKQLESCEVLTYFTPALTLQATGRSSFSVLSETIVARHTGSRTSILDDWESSHHGGNHLDFIAVTRSGSKILRSSISILQPLRERSGKYAKACCFSPQYEELLRE